MPLLQREIELPQLVNDTSYLAFIARHIKTRLNDGEVPIRFAITKTKDKTHQCELGVLSKTEPHEAKTVNRSIFEFSPRKHENTDQFHAVLLVPTGIGSELGGHSGDAGALARFIATACDKLITHPNVVNASDINELPENGLYVEGSVISDLFMGTAGLQETRANRILLIIDRHEEPRITHLTINTASAARTAAGIEIPLVVELDNPVQMESRYSSSGCAVGRVEALENVGRLFEKYKGQYDAVALHTGIDVPQEYHLDYLQSRGEMINPWGGVEAMLTHSLTMIYDVPTAHAPMVKSMEIANLHAGVVDPRIAPEAISSTFLFSVLKGLHKSPKIIRDTDTFSHSNVITNTDISCLIIPDGCVGLPTLAAMEQGIPVIAVHENKNRMQNNLADFPFQPGKLFVVENYLEAVGVMNALKAGVAVSSIRRPFADTKIILNETSLNMPDKKLTGDRIKVVKLVKD